MAVCGPLAICQPRDYLGFFGVWLNAERVRLQWAYAAARGAGLVHGTRPEIDAAYFDAEARNEVEAAESEAEANLARMTERVAAAAGFRR